MSKCSKYLLAMFLILLWMPRAWAWNLSAELVTDLPVQVGARVDTEGPFGLRLSTSLGLMPAGYVDLINAVVVAADGYDDDTAKLVRSALKNSLVWRLHMGWRPFSNLGFYGDLGYGLVAFGGGVTAEDLISLASGISSPLSDPTGTSVYSVSSTLHMLDVELGWQWELWAGLRLRAAVGLAATVGAKTRVEPDYLPLLPSSVDVFSRSAEDYLDDIYTSYVFAPVVSLGLGYSFF